MIEKLKSKVVWISFIAIAVGVISRYWPDLGIEVDFIATAIISALTVFGILNNPNDKENF